MDFFSHFVAWVHWRKETFHSERFESFMTVMNSGSVVECAMTTARKDESVTPWTWTGDKSLGLADRNMRGSRFIVFSIP